MYSLRLSHLRTNPPCAKCVAVCCSVLQCAALCSSVWQCVAVCCSVLQCVAVCCSALQYAAVRCGSLQCVAVTCSVSQCLSSSYTPSPESSMSNKRIKTDLQVMCPARSRDFGSASCCCSSTAASWGERVLPHTPCKSWILTFIDLRAKLCKCVCSGVCVCVCVCA